MLFRSGAQPQQQAQPQTPVGPRPSVPSDDVLLLLIRSTLIALNQANVTGNYSVLRDLAAPSFKEANSADKLAQVFAKMRERKLDLSLILVIQPKLYRRAEIGPKGILRITGFFEMEPKPINFDLMFQAVQGRWRLFGIVASPAGPQQVPDAQMAPRPAPPATPEAVAPTKPAASPVKAPTATDTGSSAPKTSSQTGSDIRDRLDNDPTPPPEKPKEKSWWNPFEH